MKSEVKDRSDHNIVAFENPVYQEESAMKVDPILSDEGDTEGLYNEPTFHDPNSVCHLLM